jgi:hypothetical protein
MEKKKKKAILIEREKGLVIEFSETFTIPFLSRYDIERSRLTD